MAYGTKPRMDMDYEAESDARTLRDAMTIRSSPKRYKLAHMALKKLEKETHRTLMETRAAQGLKKAFPPDEPYSHKGSSHKGSSHKGSSYGGSSHKGSSYGGSSHKGGY